MSNTTGVHGLSGSVPSGNATMGNMTNAADAGYFDRFVDKFYYDLDAMRDSQMIMGTMFLGMVLGMIIMVLCCVKHKSDGYYRVPPPTLPEELELVVRDVHKQRRPGEARFEIGDDEDD